MTILSVMVGAAAFALGGTTATGQTVIAKSNPLPSELVSFADLNLETAAGKEVLDRRIRGAARRVCIFDADRSLENFSLGRMCYSAAVADGHSQMNEVIASGRFGTGTATATLTIRGR